MPDNTGHERLGEQVGGAPVHGRGPPREPEVFDEICSPDFVNHAAPSRTGIQGLKDVVAFSKRAQPDQHWSQLHIIAEGDLVVLYGVREATWQAPESADTPPRKAFESRSSWHTCFA